jgi:hypothetical protein
MLLIPLLFAPYKSNKLSGALPDSLILLSFRLNALILAGAARCPESVDRLDPYVSARRWERSGREFEWSSEWPFVEFDKGARGWAFVLEGEVFY